MDDDFKNFMQMDSVLERFIEETINSFVKWEMIRFFCDHPRTTYTLDALTKALNRPRGLLKKEIQPLVERGLIRQEKRKKGDNYIYELSAAPGANQELYDLVERFLSFCQSREGRLRVIYKILREGKPLST